MSVRVTAEIAGTGSCLPESSIDNFELYAMDELREGFDIERARSSLRDVDDVESLSDEVVFDRWTRQVTGIGARRILERDSGRTTEDLCAGAARRALDAAGLEAGDVDLLYLASLTCSDEVPNGACTVADRIGAPTLGGYVFNAACAGFVYGIASGWSAIVSGLAETVLVVSGDVLSRFVDYSDVRTAVLFGDGAGAVVLRRSTGDRGLLGRPVMSGEFARDPLYLVAQGWETEEEPFPKLHMVGGARILRNAIQTMAGAAGEALETAGLDWDDVDYVVPHQANLRITAGLEKVLPLSEGRVIHNIEDYGNMSASTVGITLDELVRGRWGELPDPATVVLTAIGGGYTVAAATLRI